MVYLHLAELDRIKAWDQNNGGQLVSAPVLVQV